MTSAQDRPRIGWIGVGRMGFQLAARLLDAEYDVAVYNRTRAKAEPLAERGATIADRPVDLADRDVVFTMVTASAALEAVTTSPDGVLTSPSATPGILVDSSTVSPQVSALIRNKAADNGTDFLAATVSGNPKVIAAGKLTVAVSGSPEVFGRVVPLLAALGRGVTYVGEGEAARLVKIAHNVFLGVVTQSLAEVTILAEKGGVSRAAFHFRHRRSLRSAPGCRRGLARPGVGRRRTVRRRGWRLEQRHRGQLPSRVQLLTAGEDLRQRPAEQRKRPELAERPPVRQQQQQRQPDQRQRQYE
ncbi:NAD(P)-dependent oxidoreductase [Streptomyces sp. DSM 41527]|uniref:NAD(P)-dependent oxidoreductase n=1 Tax=Streptomyces mooreae TaxID=3075523 RepID=A0ABU2SZL4_9ACTN|nr:NAD(P)-dependent oxidoreductase [Streptomyces sp. DSM 41527]MDT0454434.1 NAD(P)-dependent oxidoreductase [Streptomyces sp. DSM 41527]